MSTNQSINASAATTAQFTTKDDQDAAEFAPVDGFWNSVSEDYFEVKEALERQLSLKYGIKMVVTLYHENGHAITGDLPSCGSFLAIRD